MSEEKKKLIYKGPLFQTLIPGHGVVTRNEPFEISKELAKVLVETSAGFEYVKERRVEKKEEVKEVKKSV